MCLVRLKMDIQEGISKVQADISNEFTADNLCYNVLKALLIFQKNPIYKGCKEDEINDGIRDCLNMMYDVRDQTRQGESESGIFTYATGADFVRFYRKLFDFVTEYDFPYESIGHLKTINHDYLESKHLSIKLNRNGSIQNVHFYIIHVR